MVGAVLDHTAAAAVDLGCGATAGDFATRICLPLAQTAKINPRDYSPSRCVDRLVESRGDFLKPFSCIWLYKCVSRPKNGEMQFFSKHWS